MSLRKERQVFVEYRDGVTATAPIENRTYTMTHSDDTGDLFVTIGLNYAQDQTNELQDQVYLRFTTLDGKNLLYGEVLIDGEGVMGNPQVRHDIFLREMALALHAIYVADNPLFSTYSNLKDTPVLINFKSSHPEYNKLYGYNAIGNYKSISRKAFLA